MRLGIFLHELGHMDEIRSRLKYREIRLCYIGD